MTLEEKHSGVLGGRKAQEDAVRTPKQNRKRPLSAVLEEFDVEDAQLKEFFNNNNGAEEEDGLDGGSVPPARTSRNAVTYPSSTVSVSSLKAFFEARNGGSENRRTSPKLPRKLSPKLYRRSPPSPNLSPKILRRTVFTSPGDVRESECPRPLVTSETPASDMTRLRQMADRLCLSTRRPSVQQWRAQYVESAHALPLPVLLDGGKGDVSDQNGGGEDGRWSAERRERINSALNWIKTELQEMRTQDQQLARQLLTIHSELHQLKLARSCEEHQDMLDDVQFHLEELQEFADVLDLPNPSLTDSPLHHLGVTRMNFSARRFSTC